MTRIKTNDTNFFEKVVSNQLSVKTKKQLGAVVAVFATTPSPNVVANTATTAPGRVFFCCFCFLCHSRESGNPFFFFFFSLLLFLFSLSFPRKRESIFFSFFVFYNNSFSRSFACFVVCRFCF